MKPVKYTRTDAKTINQGTKVIYKYPTPTKDMDIGKMVIKGRHPEEDDTYIIERESSFIIYVFKGTGEIYAGDETYMVGPKDVVFVPKGNKFAVRGKMEYITFNTPAFNPTKAETITKKQP